jgi:DNA-binding transcriptional MerR regulator
MAHREPIRKSSSGGSVTGNVGSQEIPDKLYFRIGEVAKLCGVPAYVLRFWESEFPQLHPNKGGTGQRLYRRRDVEMALRIKTLLYDEGYTIPGARQAFKLELRQGKDAQPQLALGIGEPGAAPVDAKHLKAIRKELKELHSLLLRPVLGRSGVQPIRGDRGWASTATRERKTSAPIAPVTQMPLPAGHKAPRAVSKPMAIADVFDSLFDQLDDPGGL